MMKLYWLLALSLLVATPLSAQLTLDECVALAQDNYPLIRKYGLLERMKDVRLSDIHKDWLPQIQTYAQGTVQNKTPSLPEALSGMWASNGGPVSGLDEWQYKIGADIHQPVWDGGQAKARRGIEQAQDTERRAALDVRLYTVRQRVEDLFFGILLAEQQAEQTRTLQALLQSNLAKLESMHRNGTAMQSDVDMVEAQCLATAQQLVHAERAAGSYRQMLELFTGKSLAGQVLVRPEASIPRSLLPARPELRHFEARLQSQQAREASVRAATMPTVGFFAQAYYGYPGFDYFASMTDRRLSFNALAGLKVSWNIGALYHRKNNRLKLRQAAENVAVERDAFVFNTRLETRSQLNRIDELKAVMREDERIVELRTRVRKAAESQLEHGTIDTPALLAKLADEKQARLTAAYHHIQLLQSIYQLKYTLNQ